MGSPASTSGDEPSIDIRKEQLCKEPIWIGGVAREVGTLEHKRYK